MLTDETALLRQIIREEMKSVIAGSAGTAYISEFI